MNVFERVIFAGKSKQLTQAKIAEFIGVSAQAFSKWRKGDSQNNLWQHLQKIEQLMPEVRREWLWWGEGDMLKAETQIKAAQSMPLIGFASCATCGWYGTMTIPVPVDPPTWTKQMFAVMASGESMLPAGIGHGHICYCDPEKNPGRGEAVFVAQIDGTATIKMFMGTSIQNKTNFINLLGWLDRANGHTAQTSFTLDVSEKIVKTIAPVIYVRRRL